MCHLSLVSERSFLHNLWVFLQKEKKIQSGNFGLFWTVMASRLSGIDSSNISRHPSQKKIKKLLPKLTHSFFNFRNQGGNHTAANQQLFPVILNGPQPSPTSAQKNMNMQLSILNLKKIPRSKHPLLLDTAKIRSEKNNIKNKNYCISLTLFR